MCSFLKDLFPSLWCNPVDKAQWHQWFVVLVARSTIPLHEYTAICLFIPLLIPHIFFSSFFSNSLNIYNECYKFLVFLSHQMAYLYRWLFLSCFPASSHTYQFSLIPCVLWIIHGGHLDHNSLHSNHIVFQTVTFLANHFHPFRLFPSAITEIFTHTESLRILQRKLIKLPSRFYTCQYFVIFVWLCIFIYSYILMLF